MALVFHSNSDSAEAWLAALGKHLPDLEVRVWPEAGDRAGIDYALVAHPPRGMLKSFPNLKAIFSLWAGIDHFSSDPELPAGIPIVRMVEPGLTRGMTEYVLLNVLFHHRRMLEYLAQEKEKVWKPLDTPLAAERKVGVMGLGALGTDAARVLAALGFDVAGWSRNQKSVPDVTTFHGAEGLEPFLQHCEILVCLLPLTSETRGILNRRTLGLLPEGAAVINAARGELLVDDDLFHAFGTGRVAGASLDVFGYEPLVPEHPFWEHPKILVTPHCAAVTRPDTGAQAVAENIRRLEGGGQLAHVVDLDRGY